MKKTLCMILALVMLLSLTACGGGKGKSEVTELVIWGHQEEAWNKSYEKIAADFMKDNPDIKIRCEFFPYDEFESKVQTSLMSKTSEADIYEIWGGWAVDYASTGALAAMPDDMANSIRNDAYASTYGALEYDGKMYGLPMEYNIECGGLLVNKHLSEQYNLSVPTTWDEMIANAKIANQVDNGVFTVKGFDFVGWDGVPYTFAAMIMSQGAKYLNEDGSFNMTSPEAKAAFTELTNLVLEDKLTNLAGLTESGVMENFQCLYADQVLYVPHGPWVIADGLSTFELTYGVDFDYVAMPWYGDQISFPAENGWSIAVNAASSKQEAAFRFLTYFFSDDVIMAHNVACGQIPAKKSVAHSQDYLKQFPYAEPLIGILDKSDFIGYFNTDVFKEIINNVFVDYCTGGIYGSIDEALTDMQNQLNEKI